MKTIKSFIIILFATLVLASCSKDNGYQNVIPVDAPLVTSVNMASIAEKSDFANSSVSQMMRQYMGVLFSSEASKKMKAYMESPQDMGIDFREPVFIFQTPNRCFGITMKMLNKGDFEGFLKMLQLQNIASKAKENDGVMEGALLDDICFGYDDNTILLLASDEGANVSKRTLAQLFKQSRDDSFASTDVFDYCFEKNEKDISIYSNIAALPADFASTVKSFIPQGVKMTDVALEASLDFQNGKAVLGGSLVPTTDKAGEMLRDAEKNFHKIKGEYLNVALDCFPVWSCMGVNGEWLLGKLKQDASLKQMLFMIERGIDIEAMIRAVDGDVAVALPSVTSFDDYLVCGQLKNSDFLADVPEWQSGMKEYGISMQKTGTNEYLLKADGLQLNWGVNGNNLSFVTVPTVLKMSLTPNLTNKIVEANKKEITDALAYVYVDLKEVVPSLVQESSVSISPEGIAMMKILGKFKNLIAKYESPNKIEIRIELDDDKENFLKTLLK